jgi:hypothetical protein
MINIEDIRDRCECSIKNTAVGSHLDAALTELEMVRRRSQLLVRRMAGCRLDRDPAIGYLWQQLDAATRETEIA